MKPLAGRLGLVDGSTRNNAKRQPRDLRRVGVELTVVLPEPCDGQQDGRLSVATSLRPCEGTARIELIDRLLQALDSPDRYDRREAVRSLIRMKANIPEERMDALLADKSDMVREAAIYLIGASCKAERFQCLIEYLENPNHAIVRAAIIALKQLGLPQAIPHLLPFVDFTQPYLLRLAAARALGELGWKEPLQEAARDLGLGPANLHEFEIQCCLEDLSSPESNIRSSAAIRLGELRAGYTALWDALADRNHHVREAVARALAYPGQPRRTETIVRITRTVSDRNALASCGAIRSLGILLAEQIEDQTGDLPSEVRCGAVECLTKVLADGNAFQKRAAIEALARAKVHGAADTIAGHLAARNPYVVGAAIQAIGYLGAVQYAPDVVPYLESPVISLQGYAARTLAQLGHREAIPAITGCLERHINKGLAEGHKAYVAYKECLLALNTLNAVEAVPLLRRIAAIDYILSGRAVTALVRLKDPDVVQVAAAALEHAPARFSTNARRDLVTALVDMDRRDALPIIRVLTEDTEAKVRAAALLALDLWTDSEASKKA